METKQVHNFNSNKVNVRLNEINSKKCVFALNEIERKLSNSIQKSTIKSYQSNLNRKNQNRLLFRTVKNVHLTTSFSNMIKFQCPQRRKLYLKCFFECKKPISLRDFFNKNDAIKGHPHEINSNASKLK